MRGISAMRRSRTSPSCITVNISSSITPSKSTSTAVIKTPNKTPIRSVIRTPIRAQTKTPNKDALTPAITPTSSRTQPLRSIQNNENQLTPNVLSSRKLRSKLTKDVIESRKSLNSPTSYQTPSPAPYYLRRQNKSSVFGSNLGSLCTMSDSKIERKSHQQQQLKRSIQDDNLKDCSSESSRCESSVSVAIRVRPLNCRERNPENANLPILVNSETNTIKVKDKNSESLLEFSFDHCFNSTKPSSPDYVSQDKVFSSIGRPLFDKIFTGHNVCVFAYGQTGSGKSHTIMGTNDNNGLIPRFAREFFYQIQNHVKKLVIEASYFEIYNEKIHDLLTDVKNGDEKQALKIREKPAGSPYVENLSQHTISCVEDLFGILIKGNKNKAIASTMMNDRSNRSHVIFTLNVHEQKPTKNEENSAKKKTCIHLLSKINFIDLAGSERASAIGSTGDRLKEGNLINKSLLTLGKVITLLSENQSSINQHIPYRESALTYLLKDCLGGNSYTSMIATISPSVENLEESLSTLRYASKARRIVNKIKQNRVAENFDTSAMELEFENKLNKINELIKTDLAKLKKVVLDTQSNRICLVEKVNELFSDILYTN